MTARAQRWRTWAAVMLGAAIGMLTVELGVVIAAMIGWSIGQ